MAEVPFRPVHQLSEYKGKGASASREASRQSRPSFCYFCPFRQKWVFAYFAYVIANGASLFCYFCPVRQKFIFMDIIKIELLHYIPCGSDFT